jgi:multicomponent Na+:H+ antiporter subunit C
VSGFFVYAVAGWLLLMGLYGIVTSRHLVHQVLCVNVVQASTYLLLIGLGYRTGGAAPILKDIPQGTSVVDPVVQALVLTDIVVGLAVTAMLLALCLQAYKRFGSFHPDRIRELRG